MRLPRAYLQKQAFSTSVKGLTSGLIELREPALAQEDDAVTATHRLTQHSLLLWRDGRAHQYPTTLSTCQPLVPQTGVLLIRVAAVHNDRHLVGNVKQEPVANNLATAACHLHAGEHGEVLGMLTLQEQAARVIVKVSLPVVQLLLMHQNLVIVALLKQALAWRLVHAEYPPIGFVAAMFEACHNPSHMLPRRQVILYSDNHVDVVRHYADLPNLHLREDLADFANLVSQDGVP